MAIASRCSQRQLIVDFLISFGYKKAPGINTKGFFMMDKILAHVEEQHDQANQQNDRAEDDYQGRASD